MRAGLGNEGGGFDGCGGDDSVDLIVGLREFTLGAGGGTGAEPVGGFGANFFGVSGSERYEESRSAPVFIPPRLFNLGIPPANIPPSCGAAGSAGPVSLLLRSRLLLPDANGAELGGGLSPGTGGAPPIGGPEESLGLSIIGAERSFVTAFFNLAPLVMSVRSAPFIKVSKVPINSYTRRVYEMSARATYSSWDCTRWRSRW